MSHFESGSLCEIFRGPGAFFLGLQYSVNSFLRVAIFRALIFLGRQYSGGQFSYGGNISGGNFPGEEIFRWGWECNFDRMVIFWRVVLRGTVFRVKIMLEPFNICGYINEPALVLLETLYRTDKKVDFFL